MHVAGQKKKKGNDGDEENGTIIWQHYSKQNQIVYRDGKMVGGQIILYIYNLQTYTIGLGNDKNNFLN